MTTAERAAVAALVAAAKASVHSLDGYKARHLSEHAKAVEELPGFSATDFTHDRYFMEQDECSRYVADVVNPARRAENLDHITDSVARCLFRIITNKDYKQPTP